MTTADQADRDRARLRLDANVVVEAGAGTGKTTLLTDRLLFLLLSGSRAVPITKIVALTFTEKAAGEIKLRLAERLAEIAALVGGLPLGAPARERAQAILAELALHFSVDAPTAAALARRALEDMDKSQIGTIHSFAAHLLRLYPVEAGVDPGFSVDEGPLFDELFESEWAAWLDSELGERPPRPEAWLEIFRLASLEDIMALARELCGVGVLGGCDIGAADWFEATAENLTRVARESPKPSARSKILESIESVSSHLLATAAAARCENPPLPDSLPPQEFKPKTWPSEWDPELEELYKQACAAASATAPGREALLRRAAALVAPFVRRLRAAYARRGLISFDGLLRSARDLVRDRPEVREPLKRRYAALLIDEFQDTDPLQGELLLFLAEEPGRCAKSWPEATLGRGRLFVVGDPKQSIYRFRGADIAAYQRFTEKILADKTAVACDLKMNFRSPEGLIAPVNAIFSRSMRRLPGLQPEYKPLRSGKTGGKEPAVELVLVGPPARDGAEDNAEAVQRAEAAWICRWLLDHCGPGKTHRFRDVAILLRSATPLGPLLETFKARGIPYAVEMEKQFFGAPEVVDMLNALRVLEDPEDSIPLAGLLRSPLCALTDAALYRLSQAGPLDYRKPSPLRGEEGRRAEVLYAALRELRPLVGRLPAAEIVAETLRRLPLLELCAKAYHGEQTVSNLGKFSRLAAEASDARGLTLREFIADVAARLEGGRAEGESPLADEHLEAVRVMTIHKSKGLEFPVAFVSNVAGGRGGVSRKPLSLLDWGTGGVGLRLPKAGAASATMAWLERQEETRQEHETLRLLYVALTRAKTKLIVLGRHEGDKSALSSRLSRAAAWPRWDSCAATLSLGGSEIRVHRLPVDADSLAGAPPVPLKAPPELPADAKALSDRWRRRAEAAKTCEAKAWTAAPTDYLREVAKSSRLEDGVSGSTEGSLIGRVCHRLLEFWDFRGRTSLDAAIEVAALPLERLEPVADWERVRREAREILAGFLASEAGKTLACVEIIGRELPFSYGDEDVVVRGSIDLLYRKAGRLFVADYKTDAVGEKDAAASRAKYERQGQAYRVAVERALGEKCAGFTVVFLRRPDLSPI